jgi:glycosyltransferase involved in cell wall biosynthesis
VKDEDDIIEQTLLYASRHCDRIFVLDNGSTDATWDIVQDLARRTGVIVPLQRTTEPFDNGLRARIYNAIHRELSETDWWLILDGDEFLAEDPRPLISLAVDAHADRVNAWHIQFFFTERDVADWEQGKDSRDKPIFDRRRYYTINWQECRLFRNCPKRHWDVGVSNHLPHWLGPVYRRRILNRHYQYRDPEQMNKRLRLRYGHDQFSHVRSTDWRSMVCDSKGLIFHGDGDPWRFTASGVVYFYRHYWHGRVRSAIRGGALRHARRLIARRSSDRRQVNRCQADQVPPDPSRGAV